MLFLLSGQWIAFGLNLPLVVFNALKYAYRLLFLGYPGAYLTRHRIQKNNHMFDATEIFRNIPDHKRESFIKLGFYLLSFFYYLYR